MRFKKLIIMALSLLLVLVFTLSMTGCKGNNSIDDSKPTVVCTGFAQYDWVLNILGSDSANWNVIRLNDKGADMHSYQPSAEDMITLKKADLVIYTGGMSEEWVVDAIEDEAFKGASYALLDHGEPICLEEENEHEGHEHDEDGHGHEGHSHDEYDEHIWLSLKNAKEYCSDIADELREIMASANYEDNCKAYIEKLDDLDKQFETAIMESEENIIIFADRFPFRYIARDYGLVWYAAFPGCSAETEASFDTIKELSNMVTDCEPKGVFVTETGTDSLAKTVITNSKFKNVQILEVNSMQSVPAKEETSYLEIMEANLESIWHVLP